ncbi:heavy-metal-associated domain-containing protein [Alicyclobacillus acidiphilus]|uniref:heavy-metal-associated domain-containing protein n=1 Tax=Alicyclobacillus acidiphilus TaxID=182455 RepID=UPI00082D0C71|nr:copper ion binding protein [Alicyclobacillus acidiphilus]
MATITIPVKGMTCSGCVNSVTKALKGVDGVETVEVSLEANQATVTYDEAKASEDTLKEAIEDAGYDVA